MGIEKRDAAFSERPVLETAIVIGGIDQFDHRFYGARRDTTTADEAE